MPVQTKSVFINQLDGGYTVNLQGNAHYPTKVFVTIEEVTAAITEFFMSIEASVPSVELLTNMSSTAITPDLLS